MLELMKIFRDEQNQKTEESAINGELGELDLADPGEGSDTKTVNVSLSVYTCHRDVILPLQGFEPRSSGRTVQHSTKQVKGLTH